MRLIAENKWRVFNLFLVSLICSGIGVFISQNFFQLITGIRIPYGTLSAVGVVAGIVIVLCLVVPLRLQSLQMQKMRFTMRTKIGSALLRIVMLALLLSLMGVIMSFLLGLISVLFYHSFKTTLNYQQILGVLNYLISAIIILILPLFISVFWSEVKSREGFWRAFANGMRCNWRRYLKLLVVILSLFALGIIVSVLFHYTDDNILFKIIKTILLGVLGTSGLFITDLICKNSQEDKKDEK